MAVASINAEVPRISESLVSTLAQLEKTTKALESTMGEINHVVAEDSSTRYQLDNALHELAQAGRAIQLLAKTLEEQPDAIIRGRSEDNR